VAVNLRRRLRRFFRRLVDKAVGRFYEGPELPDRFVDEARLFLLFNPKATHLEWEQFAVELVASAYRAAYVRGLEAHLRSTLPEPLQLESEADRKRHEWSIKEHDEAFRAYLEGKGEGDPFAGVPPHERAQLIDELGQVIGDYRVVVVRPDGDA